MATNTFGTLTIDGVISNLNITELVKKLMEIERRPIRILQQRQQQYQTQISAWREFNTRMLALLGMIGPLSYEATFNVKKAASSNESILTARATPAAASPAQYSVTVKQLAKPHMVASDNQPLAAHSETLWARFGYTTDQTFTITVAGVATNITIDSNDTIIDFVKKINESAAEVTAQLLRVDDNNERILIQSNNTGRANAISFTDSVDGILADLGILSPVPSVTFTDNFSAGAGNWDVIQGTWTVTPNQEYLGQPPTDDPPLQRTISLARDGATVIRTGPKTILEADMMNVGGPGHNAFIVFDYQDINNYKYAGLAADGDFWMISQVVGGAASDVARVSEVLHSNTWYRDVRVAIEGSRVRLYHGDVLKIDYTFPTMGTGRVGLGSHNSTNLYDNVYIRVTPIKNEIQAAEDAMIIFNGLTVTRPSNTISDLITGVTLNLVSADPTKPVTVKVTADTQHINSSITNFVTQYNNLINFFREQLTYKEKAKQQAPLFANEFLPLFQYQLQNAVMKNINPLLRTETVAISNGNLGEAWGDYSLDFEITNVSDVQSITVGGKNYVVRAEGQAFVGGGKQVEVRLNGQLRFHDGTTYADIPNGLKIVANYMPAEFIPGSGGAAAGDYNLPKDITTIRDVKRIIANVAGVTHTFSVLGINQLFNGEPTTYADGYYVQVNTEEGINNGALRFFRVAGGIATAINVDNNTVKALYTSRADYSSLTEIGITTAAYNDPTLKINSTKLNEALTTNLEGVKNLFTRSAEALATHLKTYLNQVTSPTGQIQNIINSVKGKIDYINDRVSYLETIMARREKWYFDQFYRMEELLSRMRTQGMWLEQQIRRLPPSWHSPGAPGVAGARPMQSR